MNRLHARSAVAVAVAAGVLLATPLHGPSDTPAAAATGSATGTVDDRLRPDLVALKASDLRLQSTSSGRRLRFASSLGNKGPGPIEVRPNRNHPCPAGQHNSSQILYRDANANGRYNPRLDTSVARRRAGCMV